MAQERFDFCVGHWFGKVIPLKNIAATAGMRTKTWTGYAAKPRLSRYSMGLSAPKEIFIRFSLYQRMYESKA